MQARLDPFSFLVVSVAGWLNQRQQQVIQYLAEENRVLREHIGGRRLRFTDDQRRPYGHAYGMSNVYISPLDEVIKEDMVLQACELHLQKIQENNRASFDVHRQRG